MGKKVFGPVRERESCQCITSGPGKVRTTSAGSAGRHNGVRNRVRIKAGGSKVWESWEVQGPSANRWEVGNITAAGHGIRQ